MFIIVIIIDINILLSILSGEAHYQSGNWNEAEAAYRKSLDSKPDHLPAHLTIARLMAKQVSHFPSDFPWVRAGYLPATGKFLLYCWYL